MACYEYEGIDAVKAALKQGISMSTEDMPIKVCYILTVYGGDTFFMFSLYAYTYTAFSDIYIYI